MKLTNGQIHNYYVNYNNVNKEKTEIPFITMYKIRKNIQKLEVADKPISDTIHDIVVKFNGDTKNLELNKELAKLSDVETEVEVEKIPVSEFKDVSVSPQFMEAIFFMLED